MCGDNNQYCNSIIPGECVQYRAGENAPSYLCSRMPSMTNLDTWLLQLNDTICTRDFVKLTSCFRKKTGSPRSLTTRRFYEVLQKYLCDHNKDVFVKVTNKDTTPGYLQDKLIGLDCVEVTIQGQPDNRKLNVRLNLACVLDKIPTSTILYNKYCNILAKCKGLPVPVPVPLPVYTPVPVPVTLPIVLPVPIYVPTPPVPVPVPVPVPIIGPIPTPAPVPTPVTPIPVFIPLPVPVPVPVTPTPVPAPQPTPPPVPVFIGDCLCLSGRIETNGQFSFTDCSGQFFAGGAEAGTEICYNSVLPTTNITGLGVTPTCQCTQLPTPTPTPVVADCGCNGNPFSITSVTPVNTPTPTPTPVPVPVPVPIPAGQLNFLLHEVTNEDDSFFRLSITPVGDGTYILTDIGNNQGLTVYYKINGASNPVTAKQLSSYPIPANEEIHVIKYGFDAVTGGQIVNVNDPNDLGWQLYFNGNNSRTVKQGTYIFYIS